MDSTAIREREYHNDRFEHDTYHSGAVRGSTREIVQDALNIAYGLIREQCAGARVLDYGCGQGEATFICLRRGATFVHGIDISDVAISQSQQEAARLGVSNVEFTVMNAENLDFSDSCFDLAYGFAILHHLDIDRSATELARVLKPTGKAVFLEPLGHNPAVNLYRRLTPAIRTRDEHPLLMRDIGTFERRFRTVNCHFVNLTTLATIPLHRIPGSASVQRILRTFDRWLFRALPVLRRFAWNVVLELSEPIKAPNSVIEEMGGSVVSGQRD